MIEQVTACVDNQFDDSWKGHVENKVTEYREVSSAQENEVLDMEVT